MPHGCCARDGRRIPSATKRVRLSSEPEIWKAIRHFEETVPYGERICENCRDDLRRKYSMVGKASNSSGQQNQIDEVVPLANDENEECVEKENQHSTPTTSNEQAAEVFYQSQEAISQNFPRTTLRPKRPKIVDSDAGSFIAPEAQYSQSNNDSALFFGSEEFDFDSKLNSGERKYYLEGIESVASSEKRCFICPQKSRIRVPVPAIDNLYIKHRIYVPPNNRCCPDHLIDGVFSADSITIIRANSRYGALLSPNELGSLLNRIADEVERNRIDFDSNLISDYEYELLLGVSKENFKTLHDDYIMKSKSLKNSKNRSTRNALAIFLAKLRLGVAHEFLGFLFGMDKRRISDTISAITSALEEHFVPKYLGYHHISRENVKEHTPDLVTGLYKVDEESLVLILDGTYIYIQKSQDHQTQIETFSMHKHRNLVKAMMVVLPDGYILEAESMYKSNAKNNDAKILRDMFENPDGIRVFVKKGDHFILDRGFRDIIEYLVQQGIIPHVPHFLDLKTKQKQFTAEQANETRTVTMVRWVVEAVNGRIKHKFKFFDKEVHNIYLQFGDAESHSCKLKSFFRIACALLNAFSPPLTDNKPWHTMALEKVAERMNFNNELRISIESKQINRSVMKWTKVEANSLIDFPVLTEEDIFEITLGVYQIKNAKFYAKRHLEEDPSFKILFYKEDNSIVRAKIHSRFHNGEHHMLWIKVDSTAEGPARIPFYYCKCKVGARDVGCCSHITVVLWYLGYWRHTGQTINRMSFSSILLDAAKTVVVESEDVAE